MAAPDIHPRYRTVSASKLIEAAGLSLKAIKDADGLTYADLGQELGKSGDMAEAYRHGSSEMSMTTFLRACLRWNGRFANSVFAMLGLKLVPLDAEHHCDRKAMTIVMRAQVAMAENLEDGKLEDHELVEDREWIEAAGAVFDGWRQRLARIDGRSE
ncbi:hypothetical protein HY78_08540 [Rhizorhabdus wittichii DC-6]|nr:hypothetical protein HY78_08540 [Rhizorhabdus wittichii DC-6]